MGRSAPALSTKAWLAPERGRGTHRVRLGRFPFCLEGRDVNVAQGLPLPVEDPDNQDGNTDAGEGGKGGLARQSR